MIAVDASALADWLLQTPGRSVAVAAELEGQEDLHTLDFASLEVASVVRRMLLAGDLTPIRGGEVLDDMASAPLVRHPSTPLIPRVWELRATHSAYDAAYVALAEILEVPLVTTDAALARSHGHAAHIRLVG